jgi:aspartate racemase
MKLLGIIGGLGPESTVDYYRLFVSLYRERVRDGSFPPVVVTSIDMARLLDFVGKGDRASVLEYLLGEIRRLEAAGADVALISSNTPHIVFDELQRLSPLPMISIVDTACRAVAALDLKKVGLFGTRFTMEGWFYQMRFEREGIEVVVPEPPDLDYVHSHYMAELTAGVYRDETREGFIAIARRMTETAGIEGLILGGTELPMLLRGASGIDVPVFDTARLHVEKALEFVMDAG